MGFIKPEQTAPTETVVNETTGEVEQVIEHYRQGDHFYRIVHDYRTGVVEEDENQNQVRTFSKYRLVRALQAEGVWLQVKEWLQSQEGAWDLYLAAEDISEDEPLLAQGIAAVKELLGWTDEKVAQVLAQAEIGGAA